MPVLVRATFQTLAAAFVALAGVVGMWGAATLLTRGANDWPSDTFELVQMAGLSLLLGLGLLTSIVIVARLVGYRRHVERARDAELARLAHAALTDSLTSLGNRRAFDENLERELQRRARSGSGSGFSIVMLDLDGLKQVNDSLGHQAGDEQIQALADCMRATMRVVDSGYRIGGDEMIVLLPDQAASGAYTFAQRFQREASRHHTGVSFSCGIAETTDPDDADGLIRKADLALYDAKRSGRRIVVYSDSLAPEQFDPVCVEAPRASLDLAINTQAHAG